MTRPEPRLALTGAGVRYAGRRRPALEGVDVDVRSGERVGVTGRSGAGKSTLALLAGGFIPRVVHARTCGVTSVGGLDVTKPLDPGALLGRVGIVFASPANQLSASKRTVREELAFGLENLAVPRQAMDTRIDGVLRQLGIGHLADREPLALSGGEQQRVAIAAIIAMGPTILVLDEPTSQLDPAGRRDVAALLDTLAVGGAAILCAEHDAGMLGGMERIMVLEQGRVVGTDRPGVALGRTVAGSVGLPSPSLVRLAEFAGVGGDSAFDEAAIAAGLSSASSAIRHGSLASRRQARTDDWRTPDRAGADSRPVPAGWTPVRDREGVEVEFDGIHYSYEGDIAAVRDASLRVVAGEAVAIIGQNGSGKTTLVKHVNGLLRPDAGEVRIDGRNIAADRIERLAATVGFVFQDPADQLFERSVEREVAFGPRSLGIDADLTAALVDQSLEVVGLGHERATNPYDLDLSLRRLVSLASVLAQDPAVLVLDEPTAGQDAEAVLLITSIIRAWCAGGRTAIAITHDMEFAALAFDRVVVMRDGSLVADGPPGQILSMAQAPLLASTGLTPPPTARVAAALGLETAPAGVDALLSILQSDT